MLRRVVLVLILLVAIAAGAVYWFFSGDAVRRALEQQATAWLGQPVRIGSASARLFPRVAIHLSDVRVGEPVRLTLADVEVSTGLRALLSRRVEDAEIVLANSRIDLPLPFAIPQSRGTAAPSGGEGGFTVASIRAITLRDIRIASRGREVVVSADSSLVGSRLDLSRFTARSGKTALDARGVVELEPRMDAKLEASANELDLDDVVALADAFTPPAPAQPRSGPLLPGRIAAKLSAARAHVAGVEATKLTSTLLAQGNRIMLSPTSFELFGGHYEGALDVTAGDTLTVALSSRLNDIDVGQLSAFGGVPGAVTGRLAATGRFSGRGRDIASVLAAASGSGTATIANGTIQRLDLVRAVVLFFGKPEGNAPQSEGNRFDSIDANFSLAQQVVRAESFAMHSPDVDVAGSGTLTIPTKALDGRADLILSPTLASQAGTDLVRFAREGERVVLPATIGGTIDHPRVMIDVSAATKRGLRNEVERRLKGVFDRLKPPSEQ